MAYYKKYGDPKDEEKKRMRISKGAPNAYNTDVTMETPRTYADDNSSNDQSTNNNMQEAPNPTGEETPSAIGDQDFYYSDYTPSDSVLQADLLLKDLIANRPDGYTSTWEGQLNDIINQILNRDKFSYDMNKDALYQQYKDQYINMGNLAMQDTMGQASAMTGGYGNTYAQTAGQMAYQNYLQQLNDKVPELYQLALNKYNTEGQELYNQYSMLGQMDDRDYGRYRDTVNDWYADRDYYTDSYYNERDFDYGKYVDDRDFKYTQNRDEIEDKRWNTQYVDSKTSEAYERLTGLIALGYTPTDEELAAAGMTRAQADAIASGSSNGGDGGDGYYYGDLGDGEPTLDPGTLSEDQIRQMQWSLGVNVTGVWDQATADAAGYSNADDAYKAWFKGEIGESKNEMLFEANRINMAIKDMTADEKMNYIMDAVEKGLIDDEMAAELFVVNGLV